MPENPRLFSLGMNGILSERSGGLFRHVWHGRRSCQVCQRPETPGFRPGSGSFLCPVKKLYQSSALFDIVVRNMRKLRIFLTI